MDVRRSTLSVSASKIDVGISLHDLYDGVSHLLYIVQIIYYAVCIMDTGYVTLYVGDI